jgi:CRP-like cAMP-binding protein
MYVRDVEIEKYVDGKTEEYAKHSYIIKEGSPFRGLFYIQRGIVKILKKDNRGKDLLMCFISKGDVIGLTTYFNDENYQFSALAMNDCKLLFVNPYDFAEMMNSSNEINKRMMEVLILRIHFLENWLTNVLNLSIDKRIAEALIYHSLASDNIERDIQEKNDIVVNYSIDEMAGLTGSSNSYVTKILQQFSKLNLIQRINAEKLLITNYEGLMNIANSTETEIQYPLKTEMH